MKPWTLSVTMGQPFDNDIMVMRITIHERIPRLFWRYNLKLRAQQLICDHYSQYRTRNTCSIVASLYIPDCEVQGKHIVLNFNIYKIYLPLNTLYPETGHFTSNNSG